MAKLIEYDVSGVEESSGGGTGVKVRPGVHVAKIERCTERTEKRDGSPANDIEVALNFGEEFDWGFTYIGLSQAADWKLAEFIRALGLKDKGKLDPDKMVGKYLRVKVNSGTYEGEYSPDMGRLMKIQKGDIEAWQSGNGTASEFSQSAAAGPDTEEDGDEPEASSDSFYREGQPDPEDPNETVGSYDEWPDEDLEAEVNDRGLTLPGGRGSKKNKMMAALRADDEAQGSAEEAGDEESSEGEDDYDEWDLDQLKAEWAERELGDLPVIRGRNSDARLQAKLIEELRDDDKANPFEA